MSLDQQIKEQIRQRGPIPFAEFMGAALYAADGGYYTSDRVRIGPDGDFYTAPATHPAFAALLALQLEHMWEIMGRPSPFQVVEGGGAKGHLARDLLSYTSSLDPDFFKALSYHILEAQNTGIAHLTPAGDLDILWEPRTELLAIESGVFLSNELFDAMPRHRVTMLGGRLLEVYVGLNGDDLIDVVDEPSTLDLERYFQEIGVTLPEGCKAEVDLEGPHFLEDAARSLQRGFLITIDYGYPASHLYSEKYRNGTLLGYRHHKATTNVYIRLGRQDITSHVDFTGLAHAAEHGGMTTEDLLTQQRYLKKLGHQMFLDRLREMGLPQDVSMANRMSLLELTRPEGFGRFGVLLQSKNVGQHDIDTLLWSRARTGDPDLPPALLREDHMPLLRGRYPHLTGQSLDMTQFL